MYLSLYGKRSSNGFLSPQKTRIKIDFNPIEVEIYQDKILKIKMELNKKILELKQLRVEYNKLDKAYKSNMLLIEKLINESNIELINKGISNDEENEEEKKFKEPKKIIKYNSSINMSKSIELNKDFNNSNRNQSTKKKFLDFVQKSQLNLKLQQQINGLRSDLNEKDNIINNLNNNKNVSKYKELERKFSKMFSELIKLRENNEKLENLCENLNTKLKTYKEKIKKQNIKIKQLEDENDILKKINNTDQNKYKNNSNNLVQKVTPHKINFGINEEIKSLKIKIKILEDENKKLKGEK
jgi:chromosome segregation ATPase